MNEITNPHKIHNKEARCKFKAIAPYVLVINLVLAAVMWFASDSLFEQEQDYLGGLLAGALVICGIFSYVILILMSKKLTRVDRVSKDK